MTLKSFAGSAGALMVLAGSLAAVPSMAQGLWNGSGVYEAPPVAQFDQFRGGGLGPENGTAVSWRGSVDDTVDVYIQGGSVSSHVDSGKGVDGERSRVFSPLPDRRVRAFLTNVEGRGQVWIFQQPNRANGFTVGVRVYDPQGDRSNYHFGLGWQFVDRDRDGDRDGDGDGR